MEREPIGQVPWPPKTLDGAFATTQWTMIFEAADEGQAGASHALERLCQTYWTPVYAYIRRLGASREEAKDLAQGFFAELLEKRSFEKANPAKGKFRTYLLNGVQFYTKNDWQRRQAAKRGGGCEHWSLSTDEAEAHLAGQLQDDLTPDIAFEREWVRAVISKVSGRLRDEYVKRNSGEVYDRLAPFLDGGHGGEPYAVIAADLGSTEAAVKMKVQRLRKRFGELLREQVAGTVDSPEAVKEEIQNLLSAFR